MKRLNPFLILPYLLLAICLSACDFGIGPAHPERDAPIYLKKRGYDAKLIASDLRKENFSEELFDRLAAEKSTDVRFLIGHNPHLPARLLEKLSQDQNDFVRGGAGHSPNLTSAQIDRLFHDRSHTTRIHLAANPSITSDILVRLHQEPNMDLVWFAMNPNCPEELKEKMREQKDEQALYWLNVVEDGKKQASP
ncbi:MAG: hypothetical protein H7Y20_13435 [Bryobacteraceae bacterium]|nr:hypothetical protein [Bryobacteraceae bacterium]